MTHLTPQEFQILKARTEWKQERDSNDIPDPGLEKELVAKIRKFAKDRGYLYIINPQTQKLSWFIEPGMPDIVLFMHFGTVLIIECKAAKKGLRDKQKLVQMQYTQLGFQYHVVRSYKKFLEIHEKALRRE